MMSSAARSVTRHGSTKYLVEVVDQSGGKVWSGEFTANTPTYEVRLKRSLRAGTYWVRINAPDGLALREYELPVR